MIEMFQHILETACGVLLATIIIKMAEALSGRP